MLTRALQNVTNSTKEIEKGVNDIAEAIGLRLMPTDNVDMDFTDPIISAYHLGDLTSQSALNVNVARSIIKASEYSRKL